jgi:hypothetical protein
MSAQKPTKTFHKFPEWTEVTVQFDTTEKFRVIPEQGIHTDIASCAFTDIS